MRRAGFPKPAVGNFRFDANRIPHGTAGTETVPLRILSEVPASGGVEKHPREFYRWCRQPSSSVYHTPQISRSSICAK